MEGQAPIESMEKRQSEEAALVVPWDLRKWVASEDLLAWACEEVETLDWGNSRVVAMLEAQPQFRPKLLLTMLTWSYAIGIYDPAAIYNACFENPDLRRLSQNDPPQERSIRRFRRDNRGLLRWSLLQVMKRAVRERFQVKSARFPAGLRRFLDDAVVLRLDVARQIERGDSGF